MQSAHQVANTFLLQRWQSDEMDGPDDGGCSRRQMCPGRDGSTRSVAASPLCHCVGAHMNNRKRVNMVEFMFSK